MGAHRPWFVLQPRKSGEKSLYDLLTAKGHAASPTGAGSRRWDATKGLLCCYLRDTCFIDRGVAIVN